MSLEHNLITSVNNHGIVSPLGPYTTAALRRTNNGVPLTSADIGKCALQTDTSPPTLWTVLSVSSGVGAWGKIATAESLLSAPGAILGTEPAWWIDGVTSTIVDAGGGIASSASDASGHAFDATFVGAARPSIITSGLNTKRTLRFSTSQYGGNASFTAPAPGTQLSYIFMIVKMISNVSNGVYLSMGTNGQLAVYHDAGQNITSYNGTVKAGPLTPAGTWIRLEALFSNSASDYTAVNGTPGTLGNAGNGTVGAGYTLNANINGTGIANVEVATAFVWNGATAPDSGKRAALAAWSAGVWGV